MNLKNPLALVATLTAALATHAAAQDFSTFNLGSIDGQQGWTMRDSFGNSVTAFDQAIVDVSGTKVFRMSNAVTNGSYSNQVCSPVTSQVAGESTSSLWNNYGTNHTAPLNPPLFGATATSNRFYAKWSFRSATGAAQTGLQITVSPTAKQSTVRMGWLQMQDTGTGININFNDSTDNFFTQTTIASNLSYTQTHTIEYQIDFVEGVDNQFGQIFGNDVVKVWLNGSLIHTGTTWESYYYLNEPTVVGQPRKQAVNSLLFRVAGTAAPAAAGAGFHFTSYENGNAGAAGTAAPQTGVVAINGGSTWDGWSYHGNSKDAGVYGSGSRTVDFDLYHTSFRLPAGAVASGANRGNAHADLSTGSFQAGDLIVGVGIKFKNGQRGNTSTWTAKFDRNNTDTWVASTSVAPAAGNGVVSGSNNGGTGYVQFQSVQSATNANGAVNAWVMRSPAAPNSTSNYAPTGSTSGFQTTGNFPFWGQTFASSVDFIRGLPVRTYGVSDGSGVVSYQWLVNASAFDRAGLPYSAPFQSWSNSWSCDLNVAELTNGSVDALALNLPLLSYSFSTSAQSDLPGSSTPVDLAVADMDGDGDRDWVALTQEGALRSVVVGKNNGGSYTMSSVNIGNSFGRPVSLVTGNFDGAAGVDVAVLTGNIPPATTQNRVYVLSNNGTGSLSLLSNVEVTGMSNPTSLAAGNFNGGNDDLVVTDAGSGSIFAGKASVLLNSGSGVFAQSDLSGFTAACRGAAIADLNGDSLADVAVCDGNSSGGFLRLFAGDGSGAFSALGSALATSISPQQVVVANVDRDGDMDLLVTCTNDAFALGNGRVNAFVNNGTGTMTRSDFATDRGPVSIAAGSFEDATSSITVGGDAAVGNLSSGTISILGEWTAGAYRQAGIAGSNVLPVGMALADMNGDNYGDLVYADAVSGSVLVVNAQIMARVDSYGAGSVGTGGLTPALSAIGAPALPRLGLSNFGLRMSNCRILSPTVFVLSDGMASPLTAGMPLITTILTSWVELSDTSGNAYVSLPIPNNPVFLGAYLYSQGAVFDSNANSSFFPGLALSQGLRLRLGR